MTISRAGWWLLYAVWAVMVGALVLGALNDSSGGLLDPEALLQDVSLKPESTWMGMYLHGRKVGYVHSEVESVDGGYQIREFSRMSGSMLGNKQQMRMRMDVITDTTLALVSFDGQLEAGPYETSYEGIVEEHVLSLKVTTGGRTSEKFLPAPEPIYLSQAIKPLLQAGKLTEGDSIKLAGFDPTSLQMTDLLVIGADLEPHRLWGNDVNARKLITRMSGFSSDVYVNEEGNTLAEFGPLGLTMRRESMEMALNSEDDKGEVDFLAIYAVEPEGSLKAPRKASRVTYRLSGVELKQVEAASDRQRIIDQANGVIEVVSEPERHLADVDVLISFMQDAPFIESREKSIKEAALEAVKGGESRLDSLQKLSKWVFRSVEKKPSAGLPSALAVLQVLEGDCNEHSILFTAMARSLGIPCKVQLGVVYQAGFFYYHAWPAAWVDGRWMEFEPTFGLKNADAARIALASGDMSNASDLATVVGELKIKILS